MDDRVITDEKSATPESTSPKRRRKEVVREIAHLLIPRRSRDALVGHVLGDGEFRLPRLEMPMLVDAGIGTRHRMEKIVHAKLDIRGYIVSIGNDFGMEKDGDDIGASHSFLTVDTAEEDAVLKQPLKWISEEEARNGKWMGANECEASEFVKKTVKSFFLTITNELQLKPWDNIGWVEKVTTWTRKALRENDMALVGRMSQRARTLQGLVMSCQVTTLSTKQIENSGMHEEVFIKSYFATTREAERTITARKLLGDIVPEVMALSVKRSEGMMMLRNAGAITDSAWDQEAMINTILKVQKLSVNRISELKAEGLLVADSQWIEKHVEWILNHEILDECYLGLANEEEVKEIVRKVRTRIETIRERCRKVTKLNLPKTLVHGDLNMGNVGRRLKDGDRAYRLFDWAESFVGNPLHDIEVFLCNTCSHLAECPVDFEAGLRQFYEYWKPGGTFEEMKSSMPIIHMMTYLVIIYDRLQQLDAANVLEDDIRDFVHIQVADLMESLAEIDEALVEA